MAPSNYFPPQDESINNFYKNLRLPRFKNFDNFRIAKLKEFSEAFEASTETVSTVSYMAPESLHKSVYSRHSDIYAFGICAFEIFSERKAFGDLDGFDLINTVVTHKQQP